MAIVFSGCGRKGDEQKPVPSESPASYMKDSSFMQKLADERKELQAIVVERAPLVARMEELVKSNGQDKAALEKLPEWNDLHKKVVELNAKYEAVRQRQLAVLRERVAPSAGDARGGTSSTAKKTK